MPARPLSPNLSVTTHLHPLRMRVCELSHSSELPPNSRYTLPGISNSNSNDHPLAAYHLSRRYGRLLRLRRGIVRSIAERQASRSRAASAANAAWFSAASYAARKFGVHSGHAAAHGGQNSVRRQFFFETAIPERYRRVFRKSPRSCLTTFSPLVEMASVDEAYLDMTWHRAPAWPTARLRAPAP